MKLYFFRSGAYVKVGLAEDIERRLEQFRLANPHGIELAAFRTIPAELSRQIEASIHMELRDFARGREWFEVETKVAVRVADPIIKRAVTAVRQIHARADARAQDVQGDENETIFVERAAG